MSILFNIGFRPFFLGASVFAIVTVAEWLAVYVLHMPLPTAPLTMFQWHAHEMIYGYGMAVIAGFLLTAVKNWTGIHTLPGKARALAILFALWAVARLLFMLGSPFFRIAAFFDLAFVFCLFIAITQPVVRTRNWRQLGILSKVLLLAVGNVCFYLGMLGVVANGVYWGVYGGLYLVISLILLMGGRVIPGFTERGVGYPVKLFNSRSLALASLFLLLAFFIVEVFSPGRTLAGYLALGLFLVNGARLAGWYTFGIWNRPLLWGLHIAILFIVLGFLLFALGIFAGVSGFLATHAFAYGGIGMVTMAMMGRVALGHTGRSIHHPPAVITFSLLALTAGAIFRVVLPLLANDRYVLWITLSQVFWMIAFLLFAVVYIPVLVKPRIDGQPG